MKVALFGLGYVGTVTATCLAARGHHVVGVDTDTGKVSTVNAARSPVIEPGLEQLLEDAVSSGVLWATGSVPEALRESQLSIVCVGTPSADGGSTDLSHVLKVVAEIGAALAAETRPHTLIIRSTVPPGTVENILIPLLEQRSGRVVGDDLRVAMCPEFLREGTSVEDFFHPPLLVIGCPEQAASGVKELFGFLECPVYVVATRSAEGLKYACNAFHALKVSFTNELAQLYRLFDVDSRQVMRVFAAERQLNISSAYLSPGFAFGGSCLPKDLRSLLYLARMHSVDVPVLRAALESNEHLVREVADRVLRAVDAATDGDNDTRSVALLGLSFKHNTDDLRESPNVDLAEILLGKGIDVRIHDPVVNPSKLSGANLRYVRQRLPHLHKVLHDDPDSALRGAQVAIVATTESSVVDAVLATNPPIVIDLNGRIGGRIETMRGYQGVGW